MKRITERTRDTLNTYIFLLRAQPTLAKSYTPYITITIIIIIIIIITVIITIIIIIIIWKLCMSLYKWMNAHVYGLANANVSNFD